MEKERKNKENKNMSINTKELISVLPYIGLLCIALWVGLFAETPVEITPNGWMMMDMLLFGLVLAGINSRNL